MDVLRSLVFIGGAAHFFLLILIVSFEDCDKGGINGDIWRWSRQAG